MYRMGFMSNIVSSRCVYTSFVCSAIELGVWSLAT